ncbi:MAG: tryptophan--tRNA ligase [SAR324 cluster bacterium]|nr:tryptophan--tRNA ligase [SAR324 cluster bacterium]MEC8358229.1 tryptophan--tRNA ligase [SAR324 cluster bacterium]
MSRLRALTGIKPSGTPHLGNYLGALRPALQLQQTHDTFYFIADYHALTTVREPAQLKEHTYDLVAVFAALGMDFDQHTFFRQSDIPEVTEFSWILSCITAKGLLERAHAFKDAQSKQQEVNLGLFCYPVLQAADILLYDSNFVPVGKDQKQHLEMTRDIALRFNHLYREDVLVVPEPLIGEEVATIPGLDGQKMSKSYNNVIPLFAPAKQVRKSIMRIQTDSLGVEDSKDPDQCNIFQLYRHFTTVEEQAALAGRYRAGGMGYGEAKQQLFEAVEQELGEAREAYFQLREQPKTLEGILEKGRDKARRVALEVRKRVRSSVGL